MALPGKRPQVGDEIKLATASEVMGLFRKKEPKVVSFRGLNFKVRKMPAMAFFSSEILGLPFVAAAMEKWKNLSKPERAAETQSWMGQETYQQALKKVTILCGVVEPRFTDEVPCPDGCVPYGDVDDELKDFLSTAVLTESSFDQQVSEFFRDSASGEAAGPGHAGEEVPLPAEPAAQ